MPNDEDELEFSNYEMNIGSEFGIIFLSIPKHTKLLGISKKRCFTYSWSLVSFDWSYGSWAPCYICDNHFHCDLFWN